ncbi:MAG: hypothetical protein JF595_01280 [Sphingomonadales bacterium]|nr:hypothetical protein [Sphingomonadales bacterium]
MQKFIAVCLAASALVPLPAAARDQAPGDVAKRLADPGTQAAVTVALTALSQALLDVRIEPLRRAMAAAGDITGAGEGAAADLPPDARLRDLAGPGADKLPGEIGRRVPQAMGAAAGMAGAVQDMIPELKAMAERMKAALPPQ